MSDWKDCEIERLEKQILALRTQTAIDRASLRRDAACLALQQIVDAISPLRADDLGAVRKQAKAALDEIYGGVKP